MAIQVLKSDIKFKHETGQGVEYSSPLDFLIVDPGYTSQIDEKILQRINSITGKQAAMNNFCQGYTANKKYEVGDYVYYNDNLYYCNEGISKSTTWNNDKGKFKHTTISDQLKNLYERTLEAPIGGTPGQVLTKTQYYMKWADFPSDETLTPAIAQAVAAWMNSNLSIPENQSYLLDTSLTQTTAAAQAKATGDAINSLIKVSNSQPVQDFNKIWIHDIDTIGTKVFTKEEIQDIIAPAYSIDTSYKKGDYVIYDGALYYITANINANENTTWDDVSKKQISISEQVNNLNEQVEIIKKGEFSIDFTKYETVACTIYSDNTVLRSGNSYKSYQIPVDIYGSIIITASSRNTMISFLKTAIPNDISNGTNVTDYFATGENGRHIINAGDTQEFLLSNDVKYFFITKNSGGYDYAPANIAVKTRIESKLSNIDTSNIVNFHEAVSTIIEDSVTETKIDTTLTHSNEAADAAVTGNEIHDLKSAIDAYVNDIGLSSIYVYPKHNGNMTAITWNNVNSNYQHILIPVTSGDTVQILAGTKVVRYGLLKSYDTPVIGDSIHYSDDPNYNTRIELPQRGTRRITVPVDAQYLCLMVQYSTSCYPESLIINGLEIAQSAGKLIYEKIDNIKQYTDALNVAPLNNRDEYPGYPGQNNTWVNFSGNYKLRVLPCMPNAKIEITANATHGCTYGALKSFDGFIPTGGTIIPYSDDTNWNTRKSVTAGNSVTDILPSDANFIVVTSLENDIVSTPDSVIIDGIDYTKTVYANIENYVADQISDLSDAIDLINDKITSETFNDLPEYNANFGENGVWNQIGNNKYKVKFVPCEPNEKCLITANSENTTYIRWAYLMDTTEPVTNAAIQYCSESGYNTLSAGRTYMGITPSNCHCIALMTQYSNNINAFDYVWVNGYDYIQEAFDTPSEFNKVNWCAMGDSITAGYVSNDNASSAVNKSQCWATKVSFINGWVLDNKGIGGTGWNKATNAQVSAGTDTTSAHYLARHTDFTPYNLVTLAYGINDWKANRTIGTIEDSIETPATTIAGMRATIEAIMSSNPLCKIIVITPINCKGYSGQETGDKTTNWGRGYRFSRSGTLDEFADAMISVCNYYGIQYIDMTRYSCVNRENIQSCLLDGVHPSEATHALMAHELAKKITF